MAKSKNGPSFLISAGESETIIFWFLALGDLKPEFFMAPLTRSFDSSTALSGKPTTLKACRPLDKSTSIVTMVPFNKLTWTEYTFAKDILIFQMFLAHHASSERFFVYIL